MEIKVLKNEGKTLVFEIDAGHTISNAVKDELNKDKDVEVASYTLDHPLVGKPEFHIVAKDPVKSLKNAIKNLKDENKEFLKNFKKL